LTLQNTSTYNELTLQVPYSEMRINVAQLLKEPVGSSRRYQISETLGQEGIDLVKGEVTLVRTNRSILVQGAVVANAAAVCSRCLSPIDYEVGFDLEDEFTPMSDIASDLALSGESDSCTTIDDDHVLDLREVIRQYTLLAMPSKPLCRPDCAGLCPSCGHELNQGPCQCRWVPDQRWSRLVCSQKGE